MIEQLSLLFKWSVQTDLPDNLEKLLFDRVTECLGHRLHEIAIMDASLGRRLRALFRELQDQDLMRLLSAPQTYYFLCHGEREGLERIASFLEEALTAEWLRSGLCESSDRGIWTALGDEYFPVGQVTSPTAEDVSKWQPDRPYRAPRLTSGVPVDTFSPYARGQLPEVSGGAEEPTIGEVRAMLEKLHHAVSAVEEFCPGASQLLRRFSKVLVLRLDVPGESRYTSSSSRLCLRRPILRNAHLKEVDSAEILDGWVHETIHCLLDIVELRHPLVEPDGVRPETRARSLWTGRILDLNTYIQACFVWYGLWNLWFNAIGCRFFNMRIVLKYLAMSSRGFAKGDVTTPLKTFGPALAPGLLEALHFAQESVRAELRLVYEARTEVA